MRELCSTERCESVVKVENKVENLEGWQKSQNGAIHRVEDKVDKLLFLIIAQFAATILGAAGVILAR